jgi:YD repeat-containing protein
VLKNGMLQNFKRKKDSTNYITTTLNVYDFWGNATSVSAPDGSLSCFTFDSARGYLSERRETMAGQSSCTSDASDLVTGYLRDSALRLTKLTRPDGACVHYEYDSAGRLLRVKRRDDCIATNSGDNEEFTRDAEGLVTKIEWKDASSTVTRRQELTYYQSRRLDTLINPVYTSKYTTLQYDARGLVNEVDGAGSIGKNTYTINADARITGVSRYYTSTSHDDWTLANSWDGILQQITDGESKVINASRDDLARKVKVATVDSGTSFLVYDAASRTTTMVEAYGTSGQQTQTFTYDNADRRLNDTYAARNCGTSSPVPQIQRSYDSLPTGVTCPTGVGCALTTGRLAYVKTSLLCSASYADNSLDQETFYSYDDAGRVIREYIRDDAGRVADHQYAYNKDGSLTQVTMPSGAVLGWTYDSTGSNSDLDRATSTWRTNTSTPILDTILWYPFGPLQQYNQQNSSSNIKHRTVITRNLAYRISNIKVENQQGTTKLHEVAITEDSKGRLVTRDYYPNNFGVQDSYFLYDQEDRVTCETTSFASSCPTSGSTIKNNQNGSPPFTAGGDWKSLLRPVPGSTGLQHTFNYPSGSAVDTFSSIVEGDGTPTLGTTAYGWDYRGNRTYDDNTSTLTHDRRDYTYDGRRNVATVSGSYYTGSAWDAYTLTSAYDHENRRVFKSFKDTTSGKEAQWFFYYDASNRLSEVRYTPDISSSSTYSLFQLFWLNGRLTLYWQTDYPSATTSRRYVGTDESGRPIDMISWPSSGNAARVWAINPNAWAFDTNVVGSTVYQPILFAGQYQDSETVAVQNDGTTTHRPGVAVDRRRTYDSFMGSFLQIDPMVERTWEPYVYAHSNPVDRQAGSTGDSGSETAVPPPSDIVTGPRASESTGQVEVALSSEVEPWEAHVDLARVHVHSNTACFTCADDKKSPMHCASVSWSPGCNHTCDIKTGSSGNIICLATKEGMGSDSDAQESISDRYPTSSLEPLRFGSDAEATTSDLYDSGGAVLPRLGSQDTTGSISERYTP